MTALTAVLCALLGLAVGSFLNVVVHRVPRGESVVRPPSACPSCGHRVRPRDNVPVLGWLLLRGRCRDCGEPISRRYPLVELSCGALFAVLAVHFGPSAALPAFLYLAAVGLALALIDVQVHRLPDVLTLPSYVVGFVLLGAAAVVTGSGGPLLRGVLGGAAMWLLYAALRLAQPGGMGYGDVKMSGVLGLYLGWLGWDAWLVGLLLAFLLGGAYGIGLLALRRAGRKTAVPFGPFMLAAALLSVLGGPAVVAGYLSLAGLSS